MSYNLQLLKKYQKNLAGLSCAFGSYFCYALSNSFAKKSAEHFHVFQLVFLRQTLIALFAIFVIVFIRKKLELFLTRRFAIHFVRSVSGLLDILFCFLAVQYMPLYDVAGLAFSHGVFVLFLTPLIIKEQISRGSGISVLLGTIGTLIIANPGADMNFFGCALSLSSGFCMALSIVFIRLLSESDSSDTILFYFSCISAVIVFICAHVSGTDFCWNSGYLHHLIFAAVSGAAAQILLTLAITYITPSICSIIAYTTMIWMSFFGYIFYDQIPDIHFYIGAVFIVAAGIYITVIRLRIENIKKIMQ